MTWRFARARCRAAICVIPLPVSVFSRAFAHDGSSHTSLGTRVWLWVLIATLARAFEGGSFIGRTLRHVLSRSAT